MGICGWLSIGFVVGRRQQLQLLLATYPTTTAFIFDTSLLRSQKTTLESALGFHKLTFPSVVDWLCGGVVDNVRSRKVTLESPFHRWSIGFVVWWWTTTTPFNYNRFNNHRIFEASLSRTRKFHPWVGSGIHNNHIPLDIKNHIKLQSFPVGTLPGLLRIQLDLLVGLLHCWFVFISPEFLLSVIVGNLSSS